MPWASADFFFMGTYLSEARSHYSPFHLTTLSTSLSFFLNIVSWVSPACKLQKNSASNKTDKHFIEHVAVALKQLICQTLGEGISRLTLEISASTMYLTSLQMLSFPWCSTSSGNYRFSVPICSTCHVIQGKNLIDAVRHTPWTEQIWSGETEPYHTAIDLPLPLMSWA